MGRPDDAVAWRLSNVRFCASCGEELPTSVVQVERQEQE